MSVLIVIYSILGVMLIFALGLFFILLTYDVFLERKDLEGRVFELETREKEKCCSGCNCEHLDERVYDLRDRVYELERNKKVL